MSSASINFELGDYPIRKFYGQTAENIFTYLVVFSTQVFENAGVLRNKTDIANSEILDLRNIISTPFTENLTNTNKNCYENIFLSGDPSATRNPLSVATTIILSQNAPETWWTTDYTATVNGAGDGFTISVPDTATNFDWLLFPNQFFVDNGEGFVSADRITTSAGAPGFTDVLVEGVFPTLTPSATRQVKAWGFTMATIDEWSDGAIDPGSPKSIEMKIISEFTEVPY